MYKKYFNDAYESFELKAQAQRSRSISRQIGQNVGKQHNLTPYRYPVSPVST